MRHGSLFSGIGGFDLAAEWMGWENVFHCEWMEFPRKVLDYHFPNADSHIDICKTDFKKYANQIDILTGGFPCQPFSTAGKRKGTDDERYLWGEMLRAIQEIKPRFVIAENVFGITNIDGGLVFEQVCLDLEAEGYEVQPFIIPAAAKNAPHRRDRCWFIATDTKNCGCRRGMCQECANGKRQLFQNEQRGSEMGCKIERCGGIGDATHSNCNGLNKQWRYDSSRQINARSNASFKWSANTKNFDNGNTSANLSGQSTVDGRIGEQANVETNQLTTAKGICGVDKECDQCKGIISNDRCENVNCRALVQDGHERIQSSKHRGMDKNCGDISSDGTNEWKDDGTNINRMDGDVTNANSDGFNKRNSNDEVNPSEGGFNAQCDIKSLHTQKPTTEYTDLQRQERRLYEIESKITIREQFSKRNARSVRATDWENFPTQSPICGGDDGLPTKLDGITFSKWRNESIKGYGNAIVPQIAYQLFQIINDL
jgi:DNA-cytosine methyltransferase